MSSVSPAEQQALMLGALLGKAQQGAFMAVLQRDTPLRMAQADRGMRVYQANAAVLAERTLASTFPVLAQLIGMESFEPLAHHFWRQHPPQRGDVAQWGQPLAAFLDAAPQLANEPFLGDVARIEWALHLAASAPDSALDAASFALLAEGADQPISLRVSPSVYTVASAFPVASIVNAHVSGAPSIGEAAELLANQVSEHAVVWRQGFKPRVRISSAAECALLECLQQSMSIDAALNHALDHDALFDFNSWLGQAAQTGLINCAYRLPA